MEEKKRKLDREITFLESVQERLKIEFKKNGEIDEKVRINTGARALLKRALTQEDEHIYQIYSVLGYFLAKAKFNSDTLQSREKMWILVASLFAYYPQPLERDTRKIFGHSCLALQLEVKKKSPDDKGVERRFQRLLDMPLEDISVPLTAMVRQLKSKEIQIYYPQLLNDLSNWSSMNQYVQDKWARAFWSNYEKDDEKET